MDRPSSCASDVLSSGATPSTDATPSSDSIPFILANPSSISVPSSKLFEEESDLVVYFPDDSVSILVSVEEHKKAEYSNSLLGRSRLEQRGEYAPSDEAATSNILSTGDKQDSSETHGDQPWFRSIPASSERGLSLPDGELIHELMLSGLYTSRIGDEARELDLRGELAVEGDDMFLNPPPYSSMPSHMLRGFTSSVSSGCCSWSTAWYVGLWML